MLVSTVIDYQKKYCPNGVRATHMEWPGDDRFIMCYKSEKDALTAMVAFTQNDAETILASEELHEFDAYPIGSLPDNLKMRFPRESERPGSKNSTRRWPNETMATFHKRASGNYFSDPNWQPSVLGDRPERQNGEKQPEFLKRMGIYQEKLERELKNSLDKMPATFEDVRDGIKPGTSALPYSGT